ncbi:MAG TPA: GNAT family N-acetyltransferase [Thermoplasmata archaeon]|nr:GNAT family N-acetyltransferase [Thermoplasmata archaeon]
MTSEELERYLARSIPAYAADHVRDGQWSEGEALERSREEHRRRLPIGIATPNHFLYTIHDAHGGRVGELWYHLRTETGRPQVFVFWIGIDAAHRRRGYGSEALGLVEAAVRQRGADRIALHVFGVNVAAQALYARLGYAPTNVLLAKRLDAPGVAATRGSPRP